ncbi:MAG: tetratricopeptide repeat protein [Deltaproteobacteria bacterium]|nr:tetratricopeptide repeat protein [Deltaproteobacteria bacterium]
MQIKYFSRDATVCRKRALSRWLLLFLSFVLLLPAVSSADDPLEAAWQEFIKAPATSLQDLQPALDNFIQTEHQYHIRNATIYSLALLEMAARPALPEKLGNFLTRAAITISPDYAFPETALCKLLYAQQDYRASFSSLRLAIGKFKNNPQENFYASTFAWLAIAFTAIALFTLATLLLTLKYYRAFGEMGRLKLNRQGNVALLVTTVVIVLLVILVPTFLGGLLLLAAAISLLTTRRDTIALALLLATLLVVPLAYEKGMTSLLALDSSFLRAARQTASGLATSTDRGEPEADSGSRRPASNQSQLLLQLFNQAENARLRGEYTQAEIFLDKIIAEKIELGAVYNNLANLYLLQKKAAPAEAAYLKACDLEKESGIPFYNLSQAYIRQSFDLEKSSRALEQAFRLSPELNQGPNPDLNQTSASRQNEADLIFMPLPVNIYHRFADSQPGKETFLPEFLHRVLFPGATSHIYYALILLFLGGLLLQAKRAPANRRLCAQCGRLFYPTRKLKNSECPACRLGRLPAATLLLHGEGNEDKPLHEERVIPLLVRIGNITIPGFYQFFTGNLFIAIGLLLPLVLWCYNFLICRTGIMESFPPSTAWLTMVFPILLWSLSLSTLAWAHFRRGRRRGTESKA